MIFLEKLVLLTRHYAICTIYFIYDMLIDNEQASIAKQVYEDRRFGEAFASHQIE